VNWKSFLFGLVIGLVLSLGAFLAIGSRYRVTSGGPGGVMLVKLDTWTGRSWMAGYYKKDGATTWYWQALKNR